MLSGMPSEPQPAPVGNGDVYGDPDASRSPSGSPHSEGSAQQQEECVCQVLGCGAQLSEAKTYCQRKRTCLAHLQADAVQLSADGVLWRFCQQCGKFEQLQKFDGNKRSCRVRLAKRRSGTRAQLLKKGPLQNSRSNAAAEATEAELQAAAAEFAVSAPLHSELPQWAAAMAAAEPPGQQPEWLAALGQQQQAAGAGLCGGAPVFVPDLGRGVDAGASWGSGSPRMALSCASDGVPLAAATAEVSAAAACAAAAAQPHGVLSAPLPQVLLPQPQPARPFAGGSFSHASPQLAGVGQALPDAAVDPLMQQLLSVEGGEDEDPMSQADLLHALQAGSSSGGAWQLPHGGGLLNAAAAGQPTGCSTQLAALQLSPAAEQQLLQPSGSPSGSKSSRGGEPGGPLLRLHSTCSTARGACSAGAVVDGGGSAALQQQLLQQQLLQQQLAAHATRSEQPRGRRNSRLQWLIAQMQAELESCGPGDLDSLDDSELGLVMQAALAPPAAAPGPACRSHSATAAGCRSNGSSLSQGAAAPQLGDLEAQVARVKMLQQQVQAMQLQLQLTRDLRIASGGGPAPATAAWAGGAVDDLALQRGGLRAHLGAHSSPSCLTAPLPALHASAVPQGWVPGQGLQQAPQLAGAAWPGHAAVSGGLAAPAMQPKGEALQLLEAHLQQAQAVMANLMV